MIRLCITHVGELLLYDPAAVGAHPSFAHPGLVAERFTQSWSGSNPVGVRIGSRRVTGEEPTEQVGPTPCPHVSSRALQTLHCFQFERSGQQAVIVFIAVKIMLVFSCTGFFLIKFWVYKRDNYNLS